MFGSLVASGLSRILYSYKDPDDDIIEESLDFGMN